MPRKRVRDSRRISQIGRRLYTQVGTERIGTTTYPVEGNGVLTEPSARAVKLAARAVHLHKAKSIEAALKVRIAKSK